jgi:leader peptidase (prepilin peptidase)/N-methyltransferase
VDFFLAIPYELRLAILFVLGVCAGSVLNLAIYRLAYFPRAISPWSNAPSGAHLRRASDRVPVWGWFGLRRESAIFGPGHWVRPLFIELGTGLLFAGLYHWEIGLHKLLPPLPARLIPPDSMLHAEYFSHLILFCLMIATSFIDIDEKIVPDLITVPGTLVGLLMAALMPWSLLPVLRLEGKTVVVDFLRLTSPNEWPEWLGGAPHWPSLAIGLTCYWLWCFALLPRQMRIRHGWARALRILMARVLREATRPLTVAIEVLGTAGVVAAWWRGGLGGEGLLTALVGMAAGGGIIWAARIIATFVLNKEAMGFGDVTFMAMVGTFLGWQSSLIVFFLAPFAGLVIGIVQWVLNRGPEIPFVPFLSLAAAWVVIQWWPTWEWAESIFQLGWIVPAIVLVCMALMAVMLGTWRLISQWFAK